MYEKMKELLENEKKEFKLRFGFNLTNSMIERVSGIPKATIDNFRNFTETGLEKYYNIIKGIDFSSIINKRMIK